MTSVQQPQSEFADKLGYSELEGYKRIPDVIYEMNLNRLEKTSMLQQIEMNPDNERRIKYRPKPSNFVPCKRNVLSSIKENEMDESYTLSHQKGFKRTKNGAHGGFLEMYHSEAVSKEVPKINKDDESPETELIEEEYARFSYGNQTVPVNNGRDLIGSRPVLQRFPMEVPYETRKYGVGSGFGQSGTAQDRFAFVDRF